MKAESLVCNGRDAAEFDLGSVQVLLGLGADSGLLGEIDEIGDGFERIVDLVRDGAGEAAYGVQLLRLKENLLSMFCFGDIDSEHDDSVDVAVGVAAGLIDEVEITHLQSLCGAASELDGCSASDKRLSGLVDAVEQCDEALLLRLRGLLRVGFCR